MDQSKAIDVAFDFRLDTPPGLDPDFWSPTLKRYHELLWSKPLPSGRLFALDGTARGAYLHHLSDLGEFWLASDAVIPSFTRELRLVDVLQQIPRARLDEFNRIGYTIGGMMLFPGNRVGRMMTINGARGFHPRIKDRFDLTVECIRRHYLGEAQSAAGRPRAVHGLLRLVPGLPRLCRLLLTAGLGRRRLGGQILLALRWLCQLAAAKERRRLHLLHEDGHRVHPSSQ